MVKCQVFVFSTQKQTCNFIIVIYSMITAKQPMITAKQPTVHTNIYTRGFVLHILLYIYVIGHYNIICTYYYIYTRGFVFGLVYWEIQPTFIPWDNSYPSHTNILEFT
jgi:hypothetical protein